MEADGGEGLRAAKELRVDRITTRSRTPGYGYACLKALFTAPLSHSSCFIYLFIMIFLGGKTIEKLV